MNPNSRQISDAARGPKTRIVIRFDDGAKGDNIFLRYLISTLSMIVVISIIPDFIMLCILKEDLDGMLLG